MSEKNNYLIYCHIFPNNKRYIGQTKNTLNFRFGHNGKKYKSQNVIYRAICKYGWENIEHIILESNLTQREANEKERYYIALYNTTNKQFGYNIEFGGGAEYGISDYTKQKISIANKGKIRTKEHSKHISESLTGKKRGWTWNKGVKHKPETIIKMKQVHTGKHLSEEGRNKLSLARIGGKNPSAKPTILIDLKENKETLFQCRKDIQKEIGIDFGDIGKYMKNNKIYKKRYIFKEAI